MAQATLSPNRNGPARYGPARRDRIEIGLRDTVAPKPIAGPTEFPLHVGMSDRFDPDKDAINRDRHGLPLLVGDAVRRTRII